MSTKHLPQSQQKLKTIEHYCYYLSDIIGKGFSSTVYKGRNKNNNDVVAIKVIDLRKLSQSTMKELLQSQIGIIKSLKHTNVLKCEDVFITVNNCYIVTQLCQGGDLASQIKKKGRLRGIQALRIMMQITRAVQHLAQLNIIHRDIKPANILLHNNTVKIADFGFAKYQQQAAKKQKYSVGSPLYMSPQSLFQNIYSKSNDIWSLGVVFYQILQGRPPWDPKNQRQLKDILKEKKQVFFRIAVRDQLETIIRGCLKYERTQRMRIEQILKILEQMMKQMQSQQNTAYRETLTKRNLNTLSCKDLNQTNSTTSGSISNRPPLLPKIPKPPMQNGINTVNTTASSSSGNNSNNNIGEISCTALKENNKKQDKSVIMVTQPSLILRNNKSAIDLKEKIPITLTTTATTTNLLTNNLSSLQESSRHNHWILKSVINYSRLVYKNSSRLDKLQIKQSVRLDLQTVLVDLLHYSINWLKDSVTNSKDAQKFGIINYDKFRQTRCYSKTILVINEYYQRYTKFIQKTRRFLCASSSTPSPSPVSTLLKNDSQTLYTSLQNLKKLFPHIYVHSYKIQHNICVDFLVSIVVLSEMLSNQSTIYFAQFSHIQEIVDTQPVNIVQEGDIRELMERVQTIMQYNNGVAG